MSAYKGIDPYRINHPIPSVKPFVSEKIRLKNVWDKSTGLRVDGRANLKLREVKLLCGVLPNCSGSCYIEIGGTKVIVGVNGPRPPTEIKLQVGLLNAKTALETPLNEDESLKELDLCPGVLKCHMLAAPFANSKAHKTFRREQSEIRFAQALQQALSPAVRLSAYPKLQIDLYVNVLEYDGVASGHSAAITGASVALVDAGIQMYDIVLGISGGYFTCEKVAHSEEDKLKPRKTPLPQLELVADLSKAEEELLTSPEQGVLFAIMPNIDHMTFLQESGKLDLATILTSFDSIRNSIVKQLYSAIKPVLGKISRRSIKG